MIFAFPGYENLAKSLAQKTGSDLGKLVIRNFPDGESYVKLDSDVKNKKIILVCGLEKPDEKIMALMFFAQTVKEFGALELGLVTPYLGYMRMDKRFLDGEAITSNIFAKFLSSQIDWLITIDPHLHRHKALEEIYSIPCQTLHATSAIAKWIAKNVANPILIGPDSESEQWVSEIAKECRAPFVVLEKIRRGDYDVEISIPEIEQFAKNTPVLIDDIISTARTMIGAVNHLKTITKEMPICIGVHAIFSGSAFEELKKSGAKIITCNTINHHSNTIAVDDLLAEGIGKITKFF
jgi:ribose-phosphate pyrophosphokinase